MRPIDRWRHSLFPRLNPDHKAQRIRYARSTVSGLALLLVLWLAADLAFVGGGGRVNGYDFGFDFVAIVLIALVIFGSTFLLKRGLVLQTGYLLASAIALLTAVSLFRFPGSFLPTSAGFPIATLIAGLIIGSASGYPFAVFGTLVTIAALAYASRAQSLPAGLDSPILAAQLLLGQISLSLAAAATTHALSRQAQFIVTSLQTTTEEMTQLAHTDALTGLANRRQLIDLLEREFMRARRYHRPLGLIYLDLDGFKAINDQFGHMYGDDLLRNVAKNLKAVLRGTDLLARIGGDEFAALLPETPVAGVENVATKLHRVLASYSLRLGPAVKPLTFCVGLSQIRDDDTSIDDILNRADHALLAAKGIGPGTTLAEAPSGE